MSLIFNFNVLYHEYCHIIYHFCMIYKKAAAYSCHFFEITSNLVSNMFYIIKMMMLKFEYQMRIYALLHLKK
jgi:hypothetical protein